MFPGQRPDETHADRTGRPESIDTPRWRLILARHGQTAWNLQDRFRGRRDIPLDPTGVRQAEAAAARIAARWRPAAVYSSPLARALRTALAIGARLDLEVAVRHDLVDIDCGEWEGLTPDQVRSRWPADLESWFGARPSFRMPGGESIDDVRRRARGAVLDVTARHPAQTIVMVAHAAVNRAILLEILGAGNDRFWRLEQDTCCLNLVEARRAGPTLVTLNDTCHLSEGRRAGTEPAAPGHVGSAGS